MLVTYTKIEFQNQKVETELYQTLFTLSNFQSIEGSSVKIWSVHKGPQIFKRMYDFDLSPVTGSIESVCQVKSSA